MARSRAHPLRRLSAGVGAQGLNSFTNFAFTLLAARALPAADFGWLSLGLLFCLLPLGGLRALVGDVTMVLEPAAYTAADARAAATQLAVIATGLLLLVNHGIGTELSPLAIVCLVVPLLADANRMRILSEQRPSDLLVLEALVGVLQIGGAIALGRHSAGPGHYLAAWALATAPLALTFPGLSVQPRRLLAWWRCHRPLVSRFGLEWALGMGGTQAVLIAAGAVLAAEDVGAIRAIQVLMGPIGVLYVGAAAVILPSYRSASWTKLRRMAVALSGALGAASLAMVLALRLLPDSIGRELLGSTWSAVRSFAIPIGLGTVGNVLWSGPYIALRSQRRATATLATRAASSVPLVLVPLAVMGLGAHWYAWAYGLGSLCAAGIWWFAFRVVSARSAEEVNPAAAWP